MNKSGSADFCQKEDRYLSIQQYWLGPKRSLGRIRAAGREQVGGEEKRGEKRDVKKKIGPTITSQRTLLKGIK